MSTTSTLLFLWGQKEENACYFQRAELQGSWAQTGLIFRGIEITGNLAEWVRFAITTGRINSSDGDREWKGSGG